MNKHSSADFDQQKDSILVHQSKVLESIHFPEQSVMDKRIEESRAVLRELGYDPDAMFHQTSLQSRKRALVLPTWEELCKLAEDHVGSDCSLDTLFTEDELKTNEEAIRKLNNDFNAIHRLDAMDVAIGVFAGMIGSLVDIMLIGIPERSADGLAAAPLADFVRDFFEKRFPEEDMQKLANSKKSKVPYDAQDNRNTVTYVDGLSSFYHRMLQLGHDPLLGFVFGVMDILRGTMTTIDKKGKIVSQVIEDYADRKETSIFAALAKQVMHLKSDVTTAMGLPAPFMCLFNLLQFGKIGEYEQTIAEIVQGMYYEEYDFIHFCTLAISAMLVEVIIRIGYAIKRMSEGTKLKDSIPVSLNRNKHPKLETMLFLGHSVATTANTGRLVFTKNPMAFNYPEWIRFLKYSYAQLKWGLVEKPQLRAQYVDDQIQKSLSAVYDEIDRDFAELTKEYIVVMNG